MHQNHTPINTPPCLGGQAVTATACRLPAADGGEGGDELPAGRAEGAISVAPAPVSRDEAPAFAAHRLHAGDGEDGEHDGQPHASAGKARKRDGCADNGGDDERFSAAIVTVPLFEESAHDVTAIERPNRQKVDETPVEIHEEEIVDEGDRVHVPRRAVRPE